jgi:shikimate dehydrogenase
MSTHTPIHSPIRPLAFGLLGRSLGHSFSPGYFAEKFARLGLPHVYERVEIADLQAVRELSKPGSPTYLPSLRGLNVTIPYKQAVLPYLDSLAASAVAVGAVNTIVIEPGDKWVGHNTDMPAFKEEMLTFLHSAPLPPALILGTGGASRAVQAAIAELGGAYRLVSRSPIDGQQIGYEDITAELLEAHRLVIQTTPVGMYPEIDALPSLPYEALGPEHFLFDLIYNPDPTQFLQRGAARGAATRSGLGMLHGQAERAFALWLPEVAVKENRWNW